VPKAPAPQTAVPEADTVGQARNTEIDAHRDIDNCDTEVEDGPRRTDVKSALMIKTDVTVPLNKDDILAAVDEDVPGRGDQDRSGRPGEAMRRDGRRWTYGNRLAMERLERHFNLRKKDSISISEEHRLYLIVISCLGCR
jgi:hypothetical protein